MGKNSSKKKNSNNSCDSKLAGLACQLGAMSSHFTIYSLAFVSKIVPDLTFDYMFYVWHCCVTFLPFVLPYLLFVYVCFLFVRALGISVYCKLIRLCSQIIYRMSQLIYSAYMIISQGDWFYYYYIYTVTFRVIVKILYVFLGN